MLVFSPFTKHSQCPLVRWHLQCSRQDGSHAGQHHAKLLGLLSANPVQCGNTVSEPHACSTSGHQILSMHVARTCGQNNSCAWPWLTDSIIGSVLCVIAFCFVRCMCVCVFLPARSSAATCPRVMFEAFYPFVFVHQCMLAMEQVAKRLGCTH